MANQLRETQLGERVTLEWELPFHGSKNAVGRLGYAFTHKSETAEYACMRKTTRLEGGLMFFIYKFFEAAAMQKSIAMLFSSMKEGVMAYHKNRIIFFAYYFYFLWNSNYFFVVHYLRSYHQSALLRCFLQNEYCCSYNHCLYFPFLENCIRLILCND